MHIYISMFLQVVVFHENESRFASAMKGGVQKTSEDLKALITRLENSRGHCENILSKPLLLEESMKIIEDGCMIVTEGDTLGLSLGVDNYRFRSLGYLSQLQRRVAGSPLELFTGYILILYVLSFMPI
jgi:hypothetical protein